MSNVFSFTGTVGRDAEVKQLASGQTVLNVTIANNIGYGERQQTLWIRVAVWGKRAEGKLGDYLKKGQQVFVSGELSQREYQANDGTTKTSLELNCSVIDLVGKRDSSSPAPASASAPAQKKEPTTFDDFDNVPF
nr:single-stranded DNA-binding protein [Rhodospirillales bacterium]